MSDINSIKKIEISTSKYNSTKLFEKKLKHSDIIKECEICKKAGRSEKAYNTHTKNNCKFVKKHCYDCKKRGRSCYKTHNDFECHFIKIDQYNDMCDNEEFRYYKNRCRDCELHFDSCKC